VAKLKFFDVFCGAGGTSLGLKAAGLKPVAGLDISPICAKTYRSNFRIKVYVMDAFNSNFTEILKDIDADVLVGCPPCQGFSRLKVSRGAQNDPRNGLVEVFAKAVSIMKPTYVLFENVPRVEKHPGFKKLISVLEELGYNYIYGKLNAADYGVPQRRIRLVLVAGPSRVELPPPGHGKPGSPKVRRGDLKPWRTVREAIGDLPPVEHGETHPDDRLHSAKRLPDHWLRLIRAIPKNGGTRLDAPMDLWLPTHKKKRRDGQFVYPDVFGRLHWDKPAPTITTGFTDPSKGRYVHPEQDRGLTLREGARLQTFPDDFKFHGSYTQIARQIGEAFPPLLAQKIFEYITR